MSDKVLMMRNGKTVWAPAPKTELPEGYPYKEQSETVLVEETTVQQETMYKPFTLPFFEITHGTIYDVIWDGEHYSCEAYYADHPSLGAINALGNLTTTGFESGNGEPFAIFSAASQTGVYAFDVDAHTVSISGMTETIHPMAPEFLPAGVGGGGAFYVKFTTTDNTNYTADKTFAEIVAADAAGQLIIGQVYNGTVKGSNLNLTGYLGDSSNGVFGIVFSNAYCFGDNLMMTSVMMQADGSLMALNKTMALS